MPRRFPNLGSPITSIRTIDEVLPSAQALDTGPLTPAPQDEEDITIALPSAWSRTGTLPLRARAPWATGFSDNAMDAGAALLGGVSSRQVSQGCGKFLPSYASLELRVLTPKERQDAICGISLNRLCAEDCAIREPIACRINDALHVFEWQMLYDWLMSPHYSCQDPKNFFKNPMNRMKTPYSALFRIEPEQPKNR